MINPSAQGWIDKFLSKYYLLNSPYIYDSKDFYYRTRETGYVYGHVVRIDTHENLPIGNWTSKEISKVALFNSLFGIYQLTEKQPSKEHFILLALEFYDSLHPNGFSFLKKILPHESPSIKLEKIIDERVQTNENIFIKNFSHLVTNALLFIDVLAFQNFLLQEDFIKNYIQKIEETIVGLISLALNAKTSKTNYDDLLIKLFETSVRYTKFSNKKVESLPALHLDLLQTNLEKHYLLDLAAMAIWNDRIMDAKESDFLHELADLLALDHSYIMESLSTLDLFITANKKDIPFFNYSNPIKHFYDQTTQSVVTLITRNKKRLQKELSESKELLILLALSTQRELDAQEKKKVRKQLLDVCKTIPSLTIFLLPGGSLLLPILIKFIPKILPSSFNENLES